MIDVTALGALLQLGSSAGTAPARLRCPVCPGPYGYPLLLSEDPACPGAHWYYCTECGFAGDGAELAAAVLGFDLPTTVHRLISEGILRPPPGGLSDAAIQSYATDIAGMRRQARRLWDTLRSQSREYEGGAAHEPIARALGLPLEACSPAMQRLDPYVAYSTKAKLARAAEAVGFTEQVVRAGLPTPRVGVSIPVILVAYWDAPGRLSGVLVLQVVGDQIGHGFRRFSHSALRPANEPEDPGVSFLPAVRLKAGNRSTDGRLIFVPDWRLSLLLQVRAAVAGEEPFGLVGGYSHGLFRNTRSLRTMPVDVITWADATDAMDVARALRFRATVLLEEPTPHETPRQRLLTQRPRGLFGRGRKEGKSWRSVAERYIRDLPRAQIPGFLEAADLSRDELPAFLNGCRSDVRKILTGDHTLHERSARLKDVRIVERDGGWYEEDGTLLTDMIPRIEQVVRAEPSGRTVYCGRLLFKAQELPFAVPADEFDGRPLPWCFDYLVQAGVGLGTYDRSRTDLDILSIAMQMHRPTPGTAIETVGWWTETRSWLFPKFTLTEFGELRPPAFPPGLRGRPADLFEAPEDTPLPFHLEEATSEASGRPETWAVVAFYAAQALRSAHGLPPLGLGLVGGQARRSAHRAVQACGGLRWSSVAAALQSVHRWPGIVYLAEGYDTIAVVPDVAKSLEAPGHLVAMGPYVAAALRLAGGWWQFRVERDGALGRTTWCAPLLLGYLRDRALRGLAEAPRTPHEVLTDLDTYLGRLGTATPSLALARTMLVDDDPEAAFSDLLHGVEPRALTRMGQGGLFLTDHALWAAGGISGVSVTDVAQRLAEANVPVVPHTSETRVGWRVDAGWWSRRPRFAVRQLRVRTET